MPKPKRHTRFIKLNNQWCMLIVERESSEDRVWNVGLVSHKSKRCCRDWYWSKKNKRSRSIVFGSSRQTKKTPQQMIRIWKAFKEIFRKLDPYDFILVKGESETEALAKYLKRIGIECIDEELRLYGSLVFFIDL